MQVQFGSKDEPKESPPQNDAVADDNKSAGISDEELQPDDEFAKNVFDDKDIDNPYFKVYTVREKKIDDNRKSVSNYETPKDYLKSVVAKYNIDFDFSKDGYPPVGVEEEKETKEEEEDDQWRPYIEGVLRKKDPLAQNRGALKRLVTSAFKHRFMRLYPDALVWFEVPSFLMRKGMLVNPRAKPLGILPLALVGGIKAPGLAELMAYAEDPLSDNEEIPDIDDSAMDTLEIAIGNSQAVIELRCEDWRQRFKWMECMEIAMVEGKRVVGLDELTKDTFKIKEQAEVDHLLEQGPALERQDSRHAFIPLGDNLWAGKANTIRADHNVSLPIL